MKRITLKWIVLTAALLAPTAAFAQISCSREGLQSAVDLYIAAQTKGDTSGMPLANGLGYMENVARADINNGVIKKPMKIDHHRSLLDTATCQTFTEAIVTDKANPYVLGTRLRVNHAAIAQRRLSAAISSRVFTFCKRKGPDGGPSGPGTVLRTAIR